MATEHVLDWTEAESTEMGEVLANDSFEWVPALAGAHTVGSKWVYKTKMLPNNNIERFKARLVARGFSQVPGLDYDESMTHSPVVRHTTLRAVLAHAAQANWPVHQMDVKTAYLKAPLDETVYMSPPTGWARPAVNGIRQVLKLNKSIYGLNKMATTGTGISTRGSRSLGMLTRACTAGIPPMEK
ncbi:unnamed protein product [Phaeothamnion confervicola]